jgi:outer membrane biosynthesis protein TonB
MRVGVPFSIALHVGLAIAGMIVAPTMISERTPMVILPVELLTIGPETNVEAAAAEDQPFVEELKEEVETAPEPEATPPPAPDEEIIPTETPPKKTEPKEEAPPKAAPTPPKPKPQKDESFESALQSIMKDVDKPTKATTATKQRAANLRNVDDAGARQAVGKGTGMTITVADFITSQLQSRGCWTDQEDMPDYKRLRTVIRVRFAPDGKLLGAPELREPARIPVGDSPMQTFIQRAQRALDKCNTPRYEVPREYYETTPAQWIDIEFLP